MKRLSFFVFVTLFVRLTLYSEPGMVHYAKVEAHTYNDIMTGFTDSPIELRYYKNNEDIIKSKVSIDSLMVGEMLMLVFKDFPSTFLILKCDDDYLRFIRKILDKYVKWNKKADSLGVKIEKEIESIWFGRRTVFLNIGSEVHTINGLQLTFTFFSQRVGKHQLVISFSNVQSLDNEFITHTMSSHYLWYNEVLDLRKKLDESTIYKWREKQRHQEKIEDQFK